MAKPSEGKHAEHAQHATDQLAIVEFAKPTGRAASVAGLSAEPADSLGVADAIGNSTGLAEHAAGAATDCRFERSVRGSAVLADFRLRAMVFDATAKIART